MLSLHNPLKTHSEAAVTLQIKTHSGTEGSAKYNLHISGMFTSNTVPSILGDKKKSWKTYWHTKDYSRGLELHIDSGGVLPGTGVLELLYQGLDLTK